MNVWRKFLLQFNRTTMITTNEVLDTTDKVTTQVTKKVDAYVAPVRTSVLKRFPVLFLLLTTFGVAAVFYGFERILAQYELLQTYPWLVVCIGVATLALTGRLYQKLK